MIITPKDYIEINQLLVRYCQALDFGDSAGVADCFSSDGLFEIDVPNATSALQSRYVGRAALLRFATDAFAGLQGHARHWTSPPVIDVDGRSATSVQYLTVIRAGRSPHGAILLTGVYRDSLLKLDGEWLIAHRRFSADPQTVHAGVAPTDELILASDSRANARDGIRK